MDVKDSRSPVKVVPDSDPRWAQWRDCQSQAARDSLIEAHIPLLDQVAAVVKSQMPDHIDYDDLWSAGVFGLIQAVETYDPTRAAFRTHAVFKIKNRIYDSLRAADWAPYTLRRRTREAAVFAKNFLLTSGREATDAEVEEGLGKPPGYLKALEQEVMFAVPVRMPDREEDDEPAHDAVLENLIVNALCSKVADWLATLKPFDQVCWSCRYFLGWTVAQSSKQLGCPTKDVSLSLRESLVQFTELLDEIRVTGFDN